MSLENELRIMGQIIQLDAAIARIKRERDEAIAAFGIVEKAFYEVDDESKRFAEALTFYADEKNYGEGGYAGGLVTHAPGLDCPCPEAEWEPDLGYVAREALKKP